MKQVNFLPPDPMDIYLDRWLKNWVAAVQPPRDGKQAIMQRLSYSQEPVSVWAHIYAVSRWVLDNLLLRPLDLIFEPMMTSRGYEKYEVLYHREYGSALVMRSMSQHSFPFGIGQFNLVT
ncbi:MAG: hypothetical protein PVF85_13320 [Anaerolineales bacterium]|jgi:hypothetical protein